MTPEQKLDTAMAGYVLAKKQGNRNKMVRYAEVTMTHIAEILDDRMAVVGRVADKVLTGSIPLSWDTQSGVRLQVERLPDGVTWRASLLDELGPIVEAASPRAGEALAALTIQLVGSIAAERPVGVLTAPGHKPVMFHRITASMIRALVQAGTTGPGFLLGEVYEPDAGNPAFMTVYGACGLNGLRGDEARVRGMWFPHSASAELTPPMLEALRKESRSDEDFLAAVLGNDGRTGVWLFPAGSEEPKRLEPQGAGRLPSSGTEAWSQVQLARIHLAKRECGPGYGCPICRDLELRGWRP